MNTRVFGVLQGFTGAVDIFFAGAGQAANLGLLDQFCDLADALKIAIGGNWKTGLDNVDAHCVQNLGDTQFFPQRHGGAEIARRRARWCQKSRRGQRWILVVLLDWSCVYPSQSPGFSGRINLSFLIP